ncbi:Lecithin:cholesterol/phospholipid:diacylglycerol acyltransferase [Dillenia turbinata]|uniref:Lecithin:cholesterol/phospholipid:diacylglycerol acyltransferase n=1 Tax=Dillenia turbinata TaxID=194707 RepID=A0AAN8UQU4_9MAGN
MFDGCCFRSWRCVADDDDEGVSDLNPVLLVSGMGGSILHSKRKKLGFQTRVWVRFFLADLEFKRKIWSLYNPKTGYTESLDDATEIVVPDDDYGLYAIDILDPTLIAKLVHLTEVYHFHDMINMLVKCGYKKGTTLFGYGYDFRQSNRIDKTIDGLRLKLETAYNASGGRKVTIISHSMGGLLVSCFLALHQDVFTKCVQKWICIACPFQGAPGCINDSLLTGWTMHQLLVECPSIYEMMPNPEFKWKQNPQIQVWRKNSEDTEISSAELETYSPIDSVSLFEEALRHNELDFDGKTVALPFNHSILEWASGTRKLINRAQLPEGVCFYNIFGTSFDTPFDVCYGSETDPIEDLSEICHTLPQYSYVDGDGTVPAESAQADGFAATERRGVAASHRGLLRDETVFMLIQRWLGIDQKLGKQSKYTSRVMDSSVCN